MCKGGDILLPLRLLAWPTKRLQVRPMRKEENKSYPNRAGHLKMCHSHPIAPFFSRSGTEDGRMKPTTNSLGSSWVQTCSDWVQACFLASTLL